ncbi:bone morphogenetic protein 4-like isoform X2 [Ptychodera flava]|uniref:bone morphogenetic protein 4-like isoform X2 n=1 Tax=Ptychodera flava TaxID=63121 RepID=UPI00396A54FD
MLFHVYLLLLGSLVASHTMTADSQSRLSVLQILQRPPANVSDTRSRSTEANAAEGDDAANSETPHASPKRHSSHNRLKMERLSLIRDQVLGLANRPQGSTREGNRKAWLPDDQQDKIKEILQKTLNEAQEHEGSETETEQVDTVISARVIAASCEPKRYVDSVTWKNSSSLRMYFDFSRYSPDRYDIVSAKLKVHKRASYPSIAPVVEQPPLSPEPTRTDQNGEVEDLKFDVDDAQGTELEDYTIATPDGGEVVGYGPEQTTADEPAEVLVTVYQLRYRVKHNTTTLRRKHIETRVVPVNFEGWLQFSILDAARKWAESPGRNDGVEIRVSPMFMNDADAKFVERVEASLDGCADNSNATEYEPPTVSEMYENFYPILDVVTSESALHFSGRFRGRRSAKPEKRKSSIKAVSCENSARCCASPLYVSFKELGLDQQILLPKGFHTLLCTSSCSPSNVPSANYDPKQAYLRHGASLVAGETAEEQVGVITSFCYFV